MDQILTGMIASMLAAGAVIIIAGIGELTAQRTGVMNLGLEGTMSVGAVTAIVVVNRVSQNPWLGLLGAALAGLLLAVVFGVAVVFLKADQFLVGLALTFVGRGIAGQVGVPYAGIASPVRFERIRIPFLGGLPVLGDGVFNHTILVYLAYFVLPLLAFYLLFKTRHGLSIRAAGQDPAAADACGVQVDRLRFLYTCLNGVLSGIAGAYLTLSLSPTWSEGVVAGRGWIAFALVLCANWNPLAAVLAGILFGAATALGFVVQVQGWGVSPSVLFMLPYLATLLMVLVSYLIRPRHGRDRIGIGPAALGLPFHRE